MALSTCRHGVVTPLASSSFASRKVDGDRWKNTAGTGRVKPNRGRSVRDFGFTSAETPAGRQVSRKLPAKALG
ncbi:MAG TPA: hypothetical protein EYP46_00655 [Hadesarchaea archaeon]|nr:hypothetical protein [Hadesarchaea archaeon]